MKNTRNRKYRISSEANQDLNTIWIYTNENWSKKQADYYYNLIMNEIENISLNPDYGKDANYILQGYWKTKIKHHYIFYTIGKDSIIDVIRILHEKMDIENRLR